jgi:tagatose-1,6-bisphosphate aldolase
MTHTVTFIYHTEEMKSYLEALGYELREVEVPVYRPGRYEEEIHKSIQVFKDGVNSVPWAYQMPGDYCVRFVFESELRKRLLSL